MVKAGLIGDRAFLPWCERHGRAVVADDRDAQAEAVLRACAFKAAVVGDDEREEQPSGGRALLNLGHTFGHAIEAECGYGAVLHGEAVAVGLGLAFRLSAALGHCDPADADRVEAHVASVGLPAELSMLNRRFSAARLLDRMSRDKKMRDGRLSFVLARGIGEAFTAPTCRRTPWRPCCGGRAARPEAGVGRREILQRRVTRSALSGRRHEGGARDGRHDAGLGRSGGAADPNGSRGRRCPGRIGLVMVRVIILAAVLVLVWAAVVTPT